MSSTRTVYVLERRRYSTGGAPPAWKPWRVYESLDEANRWKRAYQLTRCPGLRQEYRVRSEEVVQ